MWFLWFWAYEALSLTFRGLFLTFTGWFFQEFWQSDKIVRVLDQPNFFFERSDKTNQDNKVTLNWAFEALCLKPFQASFSDQLWSYSLYISGFSGLNMHHYHFRILRFLQPSSSLCLNQALFSAHFFTLGLAYCTRFDWF